MGDELLAELRSIADDPYENIGTQGLAADCLAEIERLQGESNRHARACAAAVEQLNVKGAEIERLRGEVSQLRELISAVNEDEWYQRVCAYEHQIATLRQRARLPEEFAAFLLGEGPFEGAWFGDWHETRTGRFWWRNVLRDILAWQEGR